MMASPIQQEKTIGYDAVIRRTYGKLKNWMVPDPIIDNDTEDGLFIYRDKRDIKEHKTTTEKNDMILTKVRSRGEHGYKEFKKLLTNTQQGQLVNFLERTESGQDTTEIERELQKNADSRLKSKANFPQVTNAIPRQEPAWWNVFGRISKWKRYLRCKTNLKNDLIDFYRQRHGNVQLSPLFKEKDTPLATFYIRPEIKIIKGQDQGEDRKPCLTDMFKSEIGRNREIYLTADAGFGKTTFSKYLATLWCQAHRPEKNVGSSLEDEDIYCLHSFDFVFLISLRDAFDLCSIDDLISKLIVSNLAHQSQFDTYFLEKILIYERCLVVLDGLDEWSHAENPQKPCHRTPTSIPHRNDREMCTILTTTRPWKLGVLNLSSNELGKQVALTSLSDESAVLLTKRSLQRLKCLPNETSSNEEAESFIANVNESSNGDLATVPLLLMYMLCLWCDGVPIGKSKCQLYVNIIELLFSRTPTTHGLLRSLLEHDTSILKCFAGHAYCSKNFTLLINLGKLAYHNLSNGIIENSLVFDESVALVYLKKEDLKTSLHIGILTESTTKRNATQISNVSFSHKTVQEFFAAIFISSQSEGQALFLEKCKNIQDILNLSTVCQFISGMNATMVCKISEGFMHVIDENVDRHNYALFDSTFVYNNPLYDIQYLLLSCLNEMCESTNAQLCIQDLFISNSNKNYLKRVSKLNKTYLKALYLNTSANLREIIELSSLTDLNYLQKLHYVGASWKEVEANGLLFPYLQNLHLDSHREKYEESLGERLLQLHSLQYLFIGNFSFSHKMLNSFLNLVSSKKSLNYLGLTWLHCNEHSGVQCEGWNIHLSSYSQLQKLELIGFHLLELKVPSLVDVRISNMFLDKNLIFLSPDMLKIERVDLFGLTFTAENLLNNIKILEILPQSVTVKMDACRVSNSDAELFRSYIRNSENFIVMSDERMESWGWRLEVKKIGPIRE